MAPESQSNRYAEWCRSPWGLVVLVILAVAFGGHLAFGRHVILTISTGVMLFAHLTLALISLRRSRESSGGSTQ